jgi:hypothetical protein
MSFIGEVVKLSNGQYAQLVPYEPTSKCNCISNCKKKATQSFPYCSKDCEAGNCTHNVIIYGQSIGRPMCTCKDCRCDQAVYNENGKWFNTCHACELGKHAPH